MYAARFGVSVAQTVRRTALTWIAHAGAGSLLTRACRGRHRLAPRLRIESGCVCRDGIAPTPAERCARPGRRRPSRQAGPSPELDRAGRLAILGDDVVPARAGRGLSGIPGAAGWSVGQTGVLRSLCATLRRADGPQRRQRLRARGAGRAAAGHPAAVRLRRPDGAGGRRPAAGRRAAAAATGRASAGPARCWRASGPWSSPASSRWSPPSARARTTSCAPTGRPRALLVLRLRPAPAAGARLAGRGRRGLPLAGRSRARRPFMPGSRPTTSSATGSASSSGIEVDGRRINLLPALLDLLARLPRSARLRRRGRRGPALLRRAHRRGGRFVTLPPERLQILLKVLSELYQADGDRQRLRFPALAARALGELEATLGASRSRREPALRWEGARRRSRGDGALAGPGPAAREQAPARRPAGRPAALPAAEGVAWLQHLRALGAGGVLADDMGLGKTLQAIAHIVAEKQAGRLDRPALVVAPTSLVGNWRRELARFAPTWRSSRCTGPPATASGAASSTPTSSSPPTPRWCATRSGCASACSTCCCSTRRRRSRTRAARPTARPRACRPATASACPARRSRTACASCGRCSSSCNPGLLGDAEWFAHRYTRPIEREGNAGPARAAAPPGRPLHPAPDQGGGGPRAAAQDRDRAPGRAARRPARSLREPAAGRPRRGPPGHRRQGPRRLDHHHPERADEAAPGLLRSAPAARRGGPAGVAESAKYELLLELLAQQRAAGRRVLVFSQFASMLALIGEGLRRAGTAFVDADRRHRRTARSRSTTSRRARPTCS